MKKYIIPVLFLIMIAAMTACGKGKQQEATTAEKETILPGGGTTTVYVITKNKKDEMSKKELLGAGTVVEGAGYVVKAGYHEDDTKKQVEWMEKAIEDKAAAIICHKTGTNEMDESTKKANEAGIPVFFIEDSTGEDGAEQEGKEAGQQAVDYLNQ